MKFATFKHRTQLYRKRKGLKSAKIRLDLTQRRRDLLNLAREKVKGCEAIDFAFADINCTLCLRMCNGDFKFFSSAEELETIITKLQ